MTFFESIPQPPPLERVQRRRPTWMRSDAVIPGSVPAEAVLIRTNRVAVAVGSVRGYPNGFEFTVHIRLRDEDRTGRPGHSDPFESHRPTGTEGNDTQLRLGVLYVDGRRAATTGEHYWPHEDDNDGRLVLQRGGGGGSGRSCDWDFWVHPLPPDGQVTFVASWLAYGVTEARAELDGAVISSAARRAVTLWPEEPDSEPDASWTARTLTAFDSDHADAADEPARPTGDAD